MSRPLLFAVGGAHVDRRGQLAGAYVPGASNPGTMREETGGGVFNALRTAVQRGVAGTLLSVRGGDAAGESVAAAIAEAGIADHSAVFLDRATPSYTAFVAADGEVIAGLADMGLYDFAFAKQLVRRGVRDSVAGADAVLADANLPAAAWARLAPLAAGKPLYAIAISPAKAVRLRGSLPALSVLFMNRREAAALAGTGPAEGAGLVARLRAAGLRAGIISAGGEAVLGFDADGAFAIRPPAPRQVADATGAGDALAGATVAALMRGLPLRQALSEGVAAAVLTIESPRAVAAIADEALAAMLALVPEAEDMR